ncbi:hypothetical protein [Burkholderia multivorans]|uniref:hypothetical protein n=1 Tax=Burkholderia multivorans TaxID=87883 RepID=UPI0021BEC408|nr:hypothetical protein [Burkholderia multivorans]
MKTPVLILALASLVATSAYAVPATDGVAFDVHGSYVDGGAIVESPQGGNYVYSNRLPDDGRRPQRFMLGKAPRQNYDLFSEKEEVALWNTRESMLAAERTSRARHSRHTASRGKARAGSILNWPKVIVVGEKTCVPTTAFATSADWQKHLVCWDKGSRHVD